MKKQLIFAGLFIMAIAISSPSFSQLRKIPGAVTDALKEKYPSAKSVTWRDKLTSYVATFQSDGATWRAKFDADGVWQASEKELLKESLPASVKDGFGKSKYADWEIKSLYELYLPEKDVQYHLTVAKSTVQKKNLLFSKDGRLLKDNITL